MVKNLPADAGGSGLTPESEDSQEEEMASHSSIPEWKIPWTKEPDRLQPMGLQRVRHG